MKTEISNNEILNSFYVILPYLANLFDEDVSFGIVDTERYLRVQLSPNLDLKIHEGDTIPKGGALFEAIKSNKVIIKNVPKEVYGIPFRSYAIPVHEENGKVSGCIVVGKSLVKTNELMEISNTLALALGQITTSISGLSSGVQTVVDMNNDILSNAEDADKSSKDTDDILNFIQGISSQTNMLGLNAAIEAARAGEAGKGFKVVATEIRKLSTSTSESVKRVDSVLKNIGALIKNINEKISKSNAVFEEQASTLQEIAASIQELNSTAQMLENLSGKV